MHYKIICSNGYKPDCFYCDTKEQANLLFNMAVASKFFEYVGLGWIEVDYTTVREWSADDETDAI